LYDRLAYETRYREPASRKQQNKWHHSTNQPYEFVKQQICEKCHTPSFLFQCIESIGTDAEMEFIHKWAALSLYQILKTSVTTYVSCALRFGGSKLRSNDTVTLISVVGAPCTTTAIRATPLPTLPCRDLRNKLPLCFLSRFSRFPPKISSQNLLPKSPPKILRVFCPRLLT
jgi:hypothetical protein